MELVDPKDFDKELNVMNIYENCKMYGPYKNKDNRLRCILVYSDGTKHTVSFPKYLIEKHLGRYLEQNETVDHIDGNPLNNEIFNLRVLGRKEHCYNDATRNKDMVVKCAYCGNEFTIKGSTIHGRNRRKHYGYFCSRQCSGKFGAKIQNHKITPIYIERVVPEKYKVRSALVGNSNVEVG